MADISDVATFAFVLFSGIVLPGVLTYYASNFLGQPMLGRVIWVAGYVGTIAVLWQYWLRPMDLTGPEGVSEETDGQRNGAER